MLGQVVEVATGFAGTARVVARLRRAGRIDVLHVANPPDTLFPLAWWLRRGGTRFIYDQHDATPELLASKMGHRPVLDRVLRALEHATYAAADMVIVSNNSCRRLAIGRSGLDPERVITVRLGPPTVAARPAPPPDVPTAVYAGVMGTQDTVEVLIDAFAEVLRGRPGAARLVLIGRGDAVDDLRRRVSAHGIEHAVTWTGWLQRSAVRRHLAAATVGVSPDVDDAYTRVSTMIKVSEYLAAGIPAIVADLPENRATAGDCAVYFRPGDSGDLADRLAEVLFDPARRAAMATAAARRAPSLRWERSARRLVAAYDHLVGAGPAVEGDQHVADIVVAAGGADMDTIPFLDLPRLHASIRRRPRRRVRPRRAGRLVHRGSGAGSVRGGVRVGPRACGCGRRRFWHRCPRPRAAGARCRPRRRGHRAGDDVHRHRRGRAPRRCHPGHRRR